MAKIKCPYCGHENILGSDHCDKCLHSFTQKDVPQPTKEKLQKKIMTELIADFIQKEPIIVGPETSVHEVIEKMHEHPAKGCALICDAQKHLVGIVSIRDILLKVAGKLGEKERKACAVRTIMTSKPEFLEKSAPLSYALHKMSIGKFRHVPVLDKGVPVGVVSTRDLIDYLSSKK
jgi:CBS domain-containing protein